MKNKRIDTMLLRLIISSILFGIGLMVPDIHLIMFFMSYVIIGYDVLWDAIEKIIKREWFDESFLMSLATIGALCIKEYPEAVAVMLFFQLGEYIQDKAVDHSRKSISSLIKLRSDKVHIKRKGKQIDVPPEMVGVGELIYVSPGERISIDGVIVEGESILNTSALTGESYPVQVHVGDSILSGSINQTGYLTIKTTELYTNSTVSRILKLMEEATSAKTETERFITKFSRIYTPIVVVLALLIFIIPSLLFGNYQEWLYRSFIFLVISCPCALVISIPLGFFSGLGVASKKGILLKGSNHLESLAHVNSIIFDKTGTITDGSFKLRKIVPNAKKEEEVLKFAAYAEEHSNHPIAYAIKEAYHKKIDLSKIKEVQEFSGHGVKAIVDGKEVFVGNTRFMEQKGIKVIHVRQMGTVVHVAVDGEYYGYLLIADEIKPHMKETIEALIHENIDKMVILSGDNDTVVQKIAKKVGIKEAYGSLLPEDKVTYVKEFMKEPNRVVIFVGDGMNDAPALVQATVGISMGGIGSDAAIEASDAVLMNSNLDAIVSGIKIGKKTLRIIWQNIILAIGIKILVLLLGAIGISSIWGAVFADVGVTIIAILNSMRIFMYKK